MFCVNAREGGCNLQIKEVSAAGGAAWGAAGGQLEGVDLRTRVKLG